MRKLFKIEGINSNIQYLDDGQIPKAHLSIREVEISRGAHKGEKTTITTIVNYSRMKKPNNPYTIRIRAESKKSGSRKVRKKDFTYIGTLHQALQDAEKQRILLLEEVTNPISQSEPLMGIPTFIDALERQLESKKNMYKSNNKIFNEKATKQFANKWLKSLYNKKLDTITKDQIIFIMANMYNKNGEPLAQRTKKAVIETINPVYTWINEQPNVTIESPTKYIKINNKPDKHRRCPFETESNENNIQALKLQFRKLYYYSLNKNGNRVHDQIRGIYTWLLHGRRLNEVLTLRWEHIDFENNTYCITAENNKPKIDMEYILTKYQRDVIGSPQKKGWVFPSITDANKHITKDTLRNHDKGLFKNGMRKHDLRHCIASYLINNGTLKEVIGVILGHTQNTTITDRYAQVTKKTAHNAIVSMLDNLLGKCLSNAEKNDLLTP